ncbi:MAG TPA: DUF429 domain-containing protein [Polyangiaceae bacterium]|nr:DUF429 domain-containing protein [Polyangiaceae bacterium]
MLRPNSNSAVEESTRVRKKGETFVAFADTVASRVLEMAGGESDVVVCIDAPIFGVDAAIARRPIEAVFQRKPFSTSKHWAGVQPNNPQGIRETVELGRLVVAALEQQLGALWHPDPAAAIREGTKRIVAETYPTLALALLSPLQPLVARRRWFSLYGQPYALMRALEAARDHGHLGQLFPAEVVAEMADEQLVQRNRDKDHVAAITSAFLADALARGRSSVFWCADGHYVLPHRDCWHPDWTVDEVDGVAVSE